MRKLLGLTILLTLSMSVMSAERSEIRKINAKVAEIKSITSTHCDNLGEYREMCDIDLQQKIKKEIRSFNTQFVSDKLNKANAEIGAIMAEEKALAKYRSILTKLSISFTNDEDSNSLRNKYDLYQVEQEELRCVASMRKYFDKKAYTYLESDDCVTLKAALLVLEPPE